jgi:acyl dehydratase
MPVSSQSVGRRTRRFHHVADARWLMAYAAALGERAPCYFDTTGVIVAHPLFPVCLEWPVVLDGRHIEGAASVTAAEAARGVHASHDLVIHRMIRAGDELYTRATIVAVEARRPGAYQLMRLDTVDADGAPVATTWQGSLSRGVDVAGGDRTAMADLPVQPPLPVAPESAGSARTIAIPVAAGLAHVYTECARIWNPIHTDRAVALRAGLPDIILHGTATLALAVSALVNDLFGGDPCSVGRVACRFASMVRMPCELQLVVDAADRRGAWFRVLDESGDAAIGDGFLGTRA